MDIIELFASIYNHYLFMPWLILWFIPMIIQLWLLKNYHPELWESIVDRICLGILPFFNVISLLMCSLHMFIEWESTKRANRKIRKEKERARLNKIEDEQNLRMKLFIKHHGHTMKDVNDFYESLGLMEKFLEKL